MARRSPVKRFYDTMREIRQSPAPGYFVLGEEIYLQDRLLETLYQAYRDRYGDGWNKYVYHASEVEGETILGQLVGETLFNDPKVVVIKEMDQLDQSGQQAVLDYLRNPGNDIVLVLHQESTRLRGKLLKKMREVTESVEVRIPWPREMEEWVGHFLRDHDMEASREVKARLVDLAGESLQQLESEIQKIELCLVDDNRTLTEELLTEIVGESRTHSVFEFIDVLGSKSLEDILSYLYSLLEEGENVSYIVRTTADFYANLWAIKAMDARGTDQREMNREVFQGRNLAWKYRKFLDRFSEGEIRQAFPLLEEADLVSKSASALDAKNYLTGFYYELLTVREESIHG